MTDTLNTLIQKINNKLKDNPLFYFTNDIERGIGLEKIIENYHLICIDDNAIVNYIKKSETNVFCLSQKLDDLNPIYRSSIKLLEHSVTQKYIAMHNPQYFQTFKISPRFEKLISEHNGILVNSSAELNRMFENKISQYEILSKFDVNFPKTIITELKNISFSQIINILGEKPILQFDKGHSGMSTIQLNSEDEFQNVRNKFPKRKVRLSQFIDSKLTYNINCCISKNGDFMAGLNYQITGHPELTNSKSTTVGNDFQVREGINNNIQNKILIEIQKIINVMKKLKFRGLFGVDFIIKDDQIFIIEINARQTQSISLLTKYQISKNQVPLSLIHLAEFLNVNLEIDVINYNQENFIPINLSQIFLRAKKDQIIEYDTKPGIYEINDNSRLQFIKTGYSIDDIENPNLQILLLSKKKGMNIKKSDEQKRMQLLDSILDQNFDIKTKFLNIFLNS